MWVGGCERRGGVVCVSAGDAERFLRHCLIPQRGPFTQRSRCTMMTETHTRGNLSRSKVELGWRRAFVERPGAPAEDDVGRSWGLPEVEVVARHRIDARVDIASPSGAVALGPKC